MGIFSTSSPFDSDIGKVLRVLSVGRQQRIFNFKNFTKCIHTVVHVSSYLLKFSRNVAPYSLASQYNNSVI
jgi:hypothetical protein